MYLVQCCDKIKASQLFYDLNMNTRLRISHIIKYFTCTYFFTVFIKDTVNYLKRAQVQEKT